MRLGQVILLCALFATAACTPKPPPRWAEGGAPLVVKEARWDRSGGDTIQILANGQVLEDGDPVLLVDRAGRVVDEDNDPVAILMPDGYLAGTDDTALGQIGVSNAAPPGSASAWLSILPNGQVIFFDSDGDQKHGGVWQGCSGPQKRTCTLVTHVLAIRRLRHRPQPGVGIGVGVGVGF